MPDVDPVLSARGRLNIMNRRKPRPSEAEFVEARRRLTAAKLERHIREAAEATPPLTQAQKQRLAALLVGREQ